MVVPGEDGSSSAWCVLVPAYDAARSVGDVVTALRAELGDTAAIFVIDDGSRDRTAAVAEASGATVIPHARNEGKGAALVTGLKHAASLGFTMALTVDADGQHPASSARRVLEAGGDPRTLVLGIRDLPGAGAPRANQLSNRISNYFLSRFAGQELADTQCGLRRYGVAETLALGAQSPGYAFEAEIVLLTIAAGLPVLEVAIEVVYPPDELRVSHFDPVRDPARIIQTVLRTVLAPRFLRRTQARAVKR
jgi:glycosyltransferase involved in cell wall biosynthesis